MLKSTAKKTVIFMIVAAILAGTAGAAYGGTGETRYSNTLEIADGFSYTNTISYNSSGKRIETFMAETEPDGDVYPIVMACDTIYGGMTVSRMTSYAETLGYNVMGAVNTDFFSTSTKVPLGAVIQNGRYLSSPEGENILAFSDDGAYIAEDVNVTITLKNGENTSAVKHLNKIRADSGGLYLYTPEFSTVSTRTSSEGWAVRFRVLEGELTVSGKVEAEVAEIIPSGTAFTIGDGYFVLTAAASAGMSSELQKYAVGDSVTIETECSSERLGDAKWATGCGDVIVSDGEITDEKSWDSSLSGTHPRTAVGIKKDGSVIYYVVDGRTSLSVGAKMSEIAEDLISEGCRYAVNMDGGGSSALSVRLPGKLSCTTVNSPSDGSERSCGTYILFVTDKRSDGETENLFLREDGAFVLAGSSLTLQYSATDSGFRNAEVPDDIKAKASHGSVSGSVYKAGKIAGEDTLKLSSSSTGAKGAGTIHVITAGDALTITDTATGKAPVFTGLSQEDTVQLSASLSYLSRGVYMDESEIEYSVSGDIGTISEDGLFTVSGTPGNTGKIRVSAGGVTKEYDVSLRVEFLDIKTHWAKEYIETLFDDGIVNGTSTSTYSPDDRILRCDFVSMLYRAAGSPAAVGSVPFSDVKSGRYYTDAITWAAQNGIAKGTEDGLFLPTDYLTREQAFTFVYRALPILSSEKVPEGSREVLERFSDASSVSEYAADATSALISLGIVSGGSGGKLDPKGSLTRAEMAKILCTAMYSAG